MDAIFQHLNSRGLHRRYGVAIGRLYVIAAGPGQPIRPLDGFGTDSLPSTIRAARADVEDLVARGLIVCIGEGDSRLCWSVEGWAEFTARAAALEEAIDTLARHGVKARAMAGSVVIAEGQVGELNRVLRELPG